jgi:hypothetical protein
MTLSELYHGFALVGYEMVATHETKNACGTKYYSLWSHDGAACGEAGMRRFHRVS